MKSGTTVSSKERKKELLFSSKGFNLGCWKKNDARLRPLLLLEMWSSGNLGSSTKLKKIKVELIIRLTLLTQDNAWKVMERESAA